jgi:hypothetical protein
MTDTLFQSVSDAEAAIIAHPACADFTSTPTMFVVYYPAPYKIPGGVSVKRGNDDLAALNLLYARIDAFWNAQRLQIPAT